MLIWCYYFCDFVTWYKNISAYWYWFSNVSNINFIMFAKCKWFRMLNSPLLRQCHFVYKFSAITLKSEPCDLWRKPLLRMNACKFLSCFFYQSINNKCYEYASFVCLGNSSNIRRHTTRQDLMFWGCFALRLCIHSTKAYRIVFCHYPKSTSINALISILKPLINVFGLNLHTAYLNKYLWTWELFQSRHQTKKCSYRYYVNKVSYLSNEWIRAMSIDLFVCLFNLEFFVPLVNYQLIWRRHHFW